MEAATNPYGRERDAELAMMGSPLRWPRWPWLPLKRTGDHGPPETGVLYAEDVDGPARWASASRRPKTTVRAYEKGAPDLAEYPSVEAMYDDGWVVD